MSARVERHPTYLKGNGWRCDIKGTNPRRCRLWKRLKAGWLRRRASAALLDAPAGAAKEE